ncbi:MAG: DUF2865 domain-containing protein [Bradyrhizobium sp.]
MPEKLIVAPSRPLIARSVIACAALLAAMLFGADARAQMNPPPSPPPGAAVNPMCPRLEAQLAMIDRGGGDPAKDEQIRRYQDSAAKQQAELDRVTSQARRMGCDSSGFFSLFNGQNAQCGPVNNQIQQMRANLDQITTNLERLRSGGLGGSDRENQRYSALLALAQNSCGPQYAAALQQQQGGPGNFLNNLFGNNNPAAGPPADVGPQSGTYRTVCVRTCDGGYFPISFATVPARFPDDEKACKALCPATEANLYAYRNPGEDMNQAVSISGQPYASSPNAFRFRQEFNPTCACKAAGQTWSDALKSLDDKAAAEQQGDIIVTEESAKKMSRPQQGKAPAPAKKGTATTTGSDPATPPAQPGAPPAPSDASSDNKSIRTVGPTFIPAR